MSKKSRTLIIALAFLVLLGGGYYGAGVWQKRKSGSAAEPYTPPEKLGNLESFDLAVIESGGLKFEKRDGEWALTLIDGKEPPAGIALDQGQMTSITYYIGGLWVDSVVEEEPADLSVYGLSNPSARAVVADSGGKQAVYLLGDATPSRSSYYVMEEGDPRVCTVAAFYAEFLQLQLDKVRNRLLFPGFEFPEIVELRIESDNTRLFISRKPDAVQPYLATSFSTHLVTSPYHVARGADGEILNSLVNPLRELAIAEFIDDDPLSLEPYGLDKPARIFLSTEYASIDLLIGKMVDDRHYAKLAGAPGVFTLNFMDSILGVKPFSLLEKFALLVNIDMVERLTISGGIRDMRADFHGKGDEGVYYLDGKKADTKTFKAWYQEVIGLIFDAEFPPGAARPQTGGPGDIVVEYLLNTSPGERASLTLIPYNRDFYALSQGGYVEFLISRKEVNDMWDVADLVVFE